jgi:hypothetical protein
LHNQDAVRPEVSAVVHAILDHLKDKAEYMTSAHDPDLTPRQLAAAALMRLRALLEALLMLCISGHARTGGMLSRAVWETWLVGTFLLVRGPDAVRDLAFDAARHSVDTGRRLGLGEDFSSPAQDFIDRNKAGAKRWRIEEMAQEVDRLLTARGERFRVQEGYDRMFRGESSASTHAGLGSLTPYIEILPERRALTLDPPALVPAERSVVLAGILVLDLARRVYDAFGLRLDDLILALALLEAFASSEPTGGE